MHFICPPSPPPYKTVPSLHLMMPQNIIQAAFTIPSKCIWQKKQVEFLGYWVAMLAKALNVLGHQGQVFCNWRSQVQVFVLARILSVTTLSKKLNLPAPRLLLCSLAWPLTSPWNGAGGKMNFPWRSINYYSFLNHRNKCDSYMRYCEVESSAWISIVDQKLCGKPHRTVFDVTAEEHWEVVGFSKETEVEMFSDLPKQRVGWLGTQQMEKKTALCKSCM